jgi:hypothetical protein
MLKRRAMDVCEKTIRRLANKEFDVELSYTDLSVLNGARPVDDVL